MDDDGSTRSSPLGPGPRSSPDRRFGWLGLGLTSQLVSNGRWILPWAAWISPVGWLVFVDRCSPRTGLTVAVVGQIVAGFVIWWEIIPAPGALYFLIAGLYALLYFLPYVAHRLLTPRIAGLAATLVFPTTWVALEFVFQRWITPYGSWGSLAYTQTDHLALLQLASLTGAPGVSFLITWLASVVAWILRPGRVRAERRRAALASALVFAGVFGYGEVRLAVPETRSEATRVAGLVPDGELSTRTDRALRAALRGEEVSSSDDLDSVTAKLNEDLFARSRREAKAGARLVAWSEIAGRVLKDEEPEFLRRAASLAVDEGIHLIVGYGVWNRGADPPLENKLAALTPERAVAWEYHKAHPIVGAESPFMTPGSGIVPSVATGFGRVGAVICHDLDFPHLLRQASGEEIGLIVGPSADWPLIAALHANMSRVRAVEQGVHLFRPTSGGRSVAFDTRGRVLALTDFTTDAVVAHVGATPAFTLYGALGDWFAWLCFVTALALAGRVVLSARR